VKIELQNLSNQSEITNSEFRIQNSEFFPKIMGILNVTPDSFSDGGKFFNNEIAVQHALQMIEDGADIIDIGGESTRPGAAEVSLEDELNRTIPIIRELKRLKPETVISIDTTKYEVAKQAVEAGASIINDISGLKTDIRLAELAAKYNVSICIMHIQGTPRTMQSNPFYKNVVDDIYNFLNEKKEFALSLGVKDIICDVGIGFGKTVEYNLELLRNLDRFKSLGTKLLLGISRKSFIGKLLNIEKPEDRDIATAMIHSILLKHDIDIIRVHNVKLISQLRYLAGIFK